MKRSAWYNVILGVFGLELRRRTIKSWHNATRRYPTPTGFKTVDESLAEAK